MIYWQNNAIFLFEILQVEKKVFSGGAGSHAQTGVPIKIRS